MEKLKPFYEFAPYDSTDDLADWSRGVKIKGGQVCIQCGELDRKLLESHHIKTKEQFPELAKELSNGECRCLFCHAVAHWSNEPVRNKILARLAIIYHLRYSAQPKVKYPFLYKEITLKQPP